MQREAVLVMQLEIELSQRRACGLMELYRATCRYRRRRGEDSSGLAKSLMSPMIRGIQS
jgi:hypothetical protein